MGPKLAGQSPAFKRDYSGSRLFRQFRPVLFPILRITAVASPYRPWDSAGINEPLGAATSQSPTEKPTRGAPSLAGRSATQGEIFGSSLFGVGAEGLAFARGEIMAVSEAPHPPLSS